MELTTDRLLLRPLAGGDAPQIQKLASDPRIAATTLAVPHPYPEGAAERWIATHDDLRARQFFVWGIELRQDATLAGVVSLRCNPVHRRAELGYWLGVPFWGQNIMTEAVRAVVNHGFDHLDLQRIYAQHLEGNLASGRVMQKAGLIYEGTLRHCVVKDGRPFDTPMYAILRHDGNANR